VGTVSLKITGRGIQRSLPTSSDDSGVETIAKVMGETNGGLIFGNLVDFDTLYGHRNDVPGYAANLERFDGNLPQILQRIEENDLLVLTADHGNDPTTPSTDHSREHVPLLVSGPRVRSDVDLGTRRTFADLGQTLAENFGIGPLAHGTSFLASLVGPANAGDDGRAVRLQADENES